MSRYFDESNNNYLDAGNPSILNLSGDQVTLSIWLKLDSLVSGEGKIIAKWTPAGFQYLLSKNADNECLFAIYNGGTQIAQGTTVHVSEVWYNSVGVYNGTDLRIYCNGILEDTTIATGNISSSSVPVRIGAGSGGLGTEEPFDGNLGHCAIWDRALSESEIKSLAVGINPLQIDQSNLLAYWPLNGQSTESDIINKNNMTVNGATKSEEPPIPNSIKAP